MSTMQAAMGGKLSSMLKARIREARKDAELSQLALAERVGVSRAAVSQWENGDTKGLRPENLLNTARVLNVRVEWLVFGEEPRRPTSHPLTPGARRVLTDVRPALDQSF